MLVINNTKRALMVITIILLSSCATPYFGYSENEWMKLTELEKNTIIAEHTDILASKNGLKHSDNIDTFKQKVIDRAHGVGYQDGYLFPQ